MKCPFCAEEIQDEAKKCRHCGEWLTAAQSTVKVQHQLTPQAATNRTSLPTEHESVRFSWLRVLIGVPVVLAIMIALLYVIDPPGHMSAAETSSTETSSSSINIGDDGVLDEGTTEVLVATSEDTLNDITQAIVANDKVGVRKIISNGHAYFVPKGIKAKFIGFGSGVTGFTIRHVRIIDGEHATDDVWIPEEYLKKQ